MAASKAASTVIDAAIAVEVSRLVCHFLYERSSIDDWEDILFCIHLLLSVDLQLIYINVVLIYCRSAISEGESQDIKATAQEANEDVDEFFILDSDSLAKLREKFCIQCLIILGEYVEVLGHVLHDKGVASLTALNTFYLFFCNIFIHKIYCTIVRVILNYFVPMFEYFFISMCITQDVLSFEVYCKSIYLNYL